MAKFKAGDKVRIKENADVGTSDIRAGEVGEIVEVDDEEEYPYGVKNIGGELQSFDGSELEKVETKSKKERSIIMKVGSMMSKILSKNVRTLVKASYLDGDLDFTEDGRKALYALLYEEYESKLVAMAEKELREAKKDC